MALTDNAKNYIKKAFGADSPLKESDPEFYEYAQILEERSRRQGARKLLACR